MIGFKGTVDGKSMGILFEPGKEYIFIGELNFNTNRLEFFTRVENIHSFYPLNESDTKIFLIEIPENAKVITLSTSLKSLTDRLIVKKELTKKEIEEYSEGNVKFHRES